MSMQEYMDTTLVQRSVHFKGPWPAVLRFTHASSLKALNALDKLPHANTAPVVFIGDSCHAMPPFAGQIGRKSCALARALTHTHTHTHKHLRL